MTSQTQTWNPSARKSSAAGTGLLRFASWISHVKGSLPLPAGQSSDEAFDRLDPLFHESGTTYERTHAGLTFRKKNPAAQDKMSVFDGGVLQIEQSGPDRVLKYHLTSRPLLFCFLAPLLFLAFAQMAVVISNLQKAPVEDSAKKDKKKDVRQLNPIDKFLGAPAPEKPKTDKKKDPDDDKPSPTPAYVFAGIFAALYVGGRILEARLIKRLFRKRLLGLS
jgi:hypothetical protein